MKALSLTLLCGMAGSLALLSTGCTAPEGPHSNVRLLMPGTDTTPPVQSDIDQDFYQPPRDPQFNTARDQ
jgi:hypothetical protein